MIAAASLLCVLGVAGVAAGIDDWVVLLQGHGSGLRDAAQRARRRL